MDCNEYKTGVDRSDCMLSFVWKEDDKMAEKSFHVFSLAVVSAHILHTRTDKNKIPLEMFYEKTAKGQITTAGTEIQV